MSCPRCWACSEPLAGYPCPQCGAAAKQPETPEVEEIDKATIFGFMRKKKKK